MQTETASAEKLQELPDEIRQLMELAKQKRNAHLVDLSNIISKKRDLAVTARRESGIERIWKEDREYYLGIDDANRSTQTYTKSMSPEGGLSGNAPSNQPSGAIAFFNITRQFVDSASARMGDILLPAGDWNFKIKPTPIPELDQIKGSQQPVVSPNGNSVLNDNGTPYTLGQFAAEEMSESTKKVEKAEKRILDWLTESKYHAESRKVIEESAQIGTGIFRGAYPAKSKARIVKNGTLEIMEKTIPSSKAVKAENFFPDPSCGDNIQNGGFVIERDYLSARKLRALKGLPGYLNSAIEAVIKEGPGIRNFDADGTQKPDGVTKDDDTFEVWYFFGDMNIDDIDAFGIDTNDIKRDSVPAIAVMVNNTIIKGLLNPLDNGEFPYDIMPWQRINGSIWGVGIARQGRVPQDMLNASARALMNNMGVSSAPQVIIRQSAIVPVDGQWELIGGKFWYAREDSDVRDVREAFTAINIPTMQVELERIIQMAYKMMEDSTGVTFLLQGQQGSAPDTVGGMELLHKNSSSLLRRIGRTYDENVTEPHIRRYYDWLLIHGEDDEKGDVQIEAIGSSALVEREIQSMQAAQLLTMSLNPVFEMSPKKAKDELLRAWRFDPSKFDMDDKEKEAAAKRQTPPAPAVQAAQIRAQSAEKIAQSAMTHEQQMKVAELDHDEQMDRNDTDRDTVYVQSQTERDRNQHGYVMQKLAIERELAMLKYANDRSITLDKVKADLAMTAMELRTQKELAAASNALESATGAADKAPQVAHPAVEPPGRADNGQAFQE